MFHVRQTAATGSPHSASSEPQTQSFGEATAIRGSQEHTVSLLHSVNGPGDIGTVTAVNEHRCDSPESTSSRSPSIGDDAVSVTSTIFRTDGGRCGLSSYRTGWICFFALGTFNNFINVVMISSAKSLSESFGASNLIGFVSWSLTSISFFTKMGNALYLQRTTHRLRVLCTVCFNLLGIATLSVALYAPSGSPPHHFVTALVALMILGGACSFSENVLVGFLKMFPPKLSGAWSSGTGFAGLFGALFYLWTATILQLENQTIYLLLAPSMVLYFAAFAAMNRSAMKTEPTAAERGQFVEDEDEYDDDGGDTVISYRVLSESHCGRLARCYRLCLFRAWMMASVYLSEYVISVGLASICNSDRSRKEQDEIYIYLSACYQIGVFVSRSSVSWWTTNRFGALAALQFFNVLIWHSQCQWLWMSRWVGLWLEYALMVWVGMLGGSMYVNVIHDILCDRQLIPNKNDRELCLNIVLVHIVFGMFSAAVYTLIMDNTFFSHLAAS